MLDPEKIRQSIAALPFYVGEHPSVTATGSSGIATTLFSIKSEKGSAVLKLFEDVSDEQPLLRARYRANAEAEALRLFGPQGLSPEFIWSGEIDGQQAVLVTGLPGETPAVQPLSPRQVGLLVAALREIHSTQMEVKIVSSTPRNLDLWWTRTHEAYRELHAPGLSAFPESAADVLNTLAHPIAADAQAHKRFWASAPLTLVHGSPERENLRYSRGRLALVNWECFGRGDPALEVATWAGLIEMWTDQTAARRFIDDYLRGNEDEALPLRIEVYGRFWSFGYLLPLLAQARTAGRSLDEDKAKTLVECFVRLMKAYERPEEEIDQVRADMTAWLGLGAISEGTRDGR